MNKDNHLIMEALQSKFTSKDPILKQVKMLVNNAIRNVFAVMETLDNVDNIPYDGELHSLAVNLDEEAGRLLGTLEDEKMPQRAENAEGPVKIDRVSASDIIKPVSQQSGPVKIDWGVEDDENASGASAAFHYDPMPGLDKTAHKIRDLLQGAANDEARTEHIIKMAQIILGSPKDYNPNEYRKMLDGLIVLLNRFIVVPMN